MTNESSSCQRYGRVTASDFQPSEEFMEVMILKSKNGRGGNNGGHNFVNRVSCVV